MALRIINAIGEEETSQDEPLRVKDILNMLNASELSGDIVAALTILAQSEFAIINSGGEFIDEDGGRHRLSPQDFQRVLDLDTVVHPITRHEFGNASKRVVPVFEMMPAFLREKEQ